MFCTVGMMMVLCCTCTECGVWSYVGTYVTTPTTRECMVDGPS